MCTCDTVPVWDGDAGCACKVGLEFVRSAASHLFLVVRANTVGGHFADDGLHQITSLAMLGGALTATINIAHL